MPIQKSDFIIVDYTGKVKETGEVFDTTSEETAKTNKLYKEGDIYEPRLIVTGEGWLLKALDEALLTFKLNKEETVEIPPEKAFGNRDPEKVKLIPVKRLVARGITPRLGAQIEYDKRLATVRTMGSGRVTLDFNPPLAGKTLVYEVTIQKQLKTAEEKVSALIHRRIPAVEVEKFEFKIGKAEVTINMPAEAFYIEGIQLAKRGISMDIQRFLPVLTTIQFVEYFAKPEVVAKAKTEVKKKTAKKSAKKTKDVEKKTIKTSEKKVEKKTEKKTKTKAKAKAKAKDISKVTK
jgi:FKBP-type peptidyl-prolyl cis-trans isomerase 2